MEILQAIKKLLPERRPIEHHESFIDGKSLITSDSTDRYPIAFRDELAKITGSEQVTLTNSGTAALHVALLSIGIKPGDEVLVPSATFVATANAVVHAGGIPHFIDGAPTIRPYKLRQYLAKIKGKHNVKAFIPVHLLGMPADMEGICQVCEEFGIRVIEDAAQALGSTINGKHVGTFGDAGILSFNNNKIVTTNGGGAILTNDPWIAAKAHQLSTTARLPHPWLIEHDAIAWNYRMGNINAALGMSQLVDFETRILPYKRNLAQKYRIALRNEKFLEPSIGEPNYWLNTILVSDRDEVLKALYNEGIRARAVFTPLHRLPMYKNNPKSDPVMWESDDLWNRAVCLPSGSNL